MDKVKSHHLDALMWMMRRAELCFEQIPDHQVISHVCHARSLVPFKAMSGSKYYGGMAFGCNVFLQWHTDSDYTMSITQVFLKGRPEYQLNDQIIAYFCFPTLGVAVPLRPGDYFTFNALIPHCISSRCNMEDDIMCTSVYLKTAIVGMHNNALELTDKQSQIANKLNLNKNK
jgi:hypothetical protein